MYGLWSLWSCPTQLHFVQRRPQSLSIPVSRHFYHHTLHSTELPRKWRGQTNFTTSLSINKERGVALCCQYLPSWIIQSLQVQLYAWVHLNASTSRLATPQPEHIAPQFTAVSFTHVAALDTLLSHITIISINTSITECLTTEITDKNRLLHWGRQVCCLLLVLFFLNSSHQGMNNSPPCGVLKTL